MVGWFAFILGLILVAVAALKQLGHIYCVPVAVGWYILLLRASKKGKAGKGRDQRGEEAPSP
jgi:hypothetical protein